MLTERQSTIYWFIVGFLEQRGYSPSFKEVREHVNLISVSITSKDLQRLKDLKLIASTGRQRGFHVLKYPKPLFFKAVQPEGEDQKLVLMEELS